jgi:hypothetical protein
MLRQNLADYVETAFAKVADGKTRRSAAFQRVAQGAAMQATPFFERLWRG